MQFFYFKLFLKLPKFQKATLKNADADIIGDKGPYSLPASLRPTAHPLHQGAYTKKLVQE